MGQAAAPGPAGSAGSVLESDAPGPGPGRAGASGPGRAGGAVRALAGAGEASRGGRANECRKLERNCDRCALVLHPDFGSSGMGMRSAYTLAVTGTALFVLGVHACGPAVPIS